MQDCVIMVKSVSFFFPEQQTRNVEQAGYMYLLINVQCQHSCKHSYKNHEMCIVRTRA